MSKIIISIQKMFIRISFNVIEWSLKQDLPEEKRKQIFDRLLKMRDKLTKQ